jgi:orotidine-5'-phosphate decarboxylase
MTSFANRLIDATRARGHPLCVGLDPHLELIPKLFLPKSAQSQEMIIPTPDVIDGVRNFSFELLRRLRGKVAVIKPQSAMFERLGPAGMMLMADLCAEAHAEGLMVINDAKRGDIGSTSTAYAQGLLGRKAMFPSDALTVNPFLGIDTLTPFIDVAKETSSGLFILVRTSNPGSADLQGITAKDGHPVYHHLARKLQPLVEAAEAKCGFSSIGIVAGATYPEEAAELRQILPTALFLVPGFGAQGGGRNEAFAGFVDGPEGPEGGVVNASRGISFTAEATEAQSGAEWRQAIDEAVDRAITTLSGR